MWQCPAVRFEGARPFARIGSVVVAITVAAAIALPAVASAAAAPVAPPPRPVFVYGDSVVLGAKSQITSTLVGDGWSPAVYAIPGVSIAQVAAAVLSARAMPDVVVLGLGYSYFWKPYILHTQVDALMYALSLRHVRRVIWLNVRESRPERRDVNAELNVATKRWGNLEVIDWNRQSTSRPGVFLSDDTHLLPAGDHLIAGLMKHFLDLYRAGAPISPPPTYGPPPTSRLSAQAFGTDDLGTINAATAAAGNASWDPFLGIAPTPDGRGFWVAERHGDVIHVGDAGAYGNAERIRLSAPIVGIKASPTGHGYWLIASDGGVFAFGDARFYGSTGGLRLNAPIVGMETTWDGRGYWLVAADGGVFSYGNARFMGSTGAIVLAQPIVAMMARPDDRGYWLVAYDGGVFSFGRAPYEGSGATIPRYWPIVDGTSAADGNGYWLLTANGQVLNYGSAGNFGSVSSTTTQSINIARLRAGGFIVLNVGPG
jgi:hypothetical protein